MRARELLRQAAIWEGGSPLPPRSALREHMLDQAAQALLIVDGTRGATHQEQRLAEEIQPIVQQSRGDSDEEWAKQMAECNEHPNAEDEQKAKEFAKKVLA